MHNTIFAISLTANLLGSVLAELGATIYRKMDELGFSGRFDVVILGLLLLGVWIYMSRWLTALSFHLNPHAPYWNSVVEKSVYAVSFLSASVMTSYISDLARSAQTVSEFSLPTLIVLVLVSVFVIFAFLIYFEENHGLTTFDFSSHHHVTAAANRAATRTQ